MLSLSASIRIFLCAEPADLRKSFDGLSALVRQALGDDPLSGHWFVFRNRKGDRLKILAWEEDGWCLWYKKQESDCPHSCPCTESGGRAHNLAVRPAPVGAVDASLPAHHTRRRPMPRPATVAVPPRAHRPSWFATSRGVA